MRRRRRLVRRAVLTSSLGVASAVTLAACSSGGSAFAGPPPQHASHVVYLDVEDPDTLPGPAGVSLASSLLGGALPRYSTSYLAQGLGEFCAGGQRFLYSCSPSLASSTTGILHVASSVTPNLVTIEAGMNALENGDSAGDFASHLAAVLGELRAHHVRTVLVTNLPPAGLAGNLTAPSGAALSGALLASGVAQYDRAIAATVSRYGAVLVDIDSPLAHLASQRGRGGVFGSPRTAGASFSLTPRAWHLVVSALAGAIRQHRSGVSTGT